MVEKIAKKTFLAIFVCVTLFTANVVFGADYGSGVYGSRAYSDQDSTGPVVSNVTSSSLTSSSVTITWTTDESATSQVEYGPTSNYSYFSNLNSVYTTSHSVVLSGLTENALYNYRVASMDASGNISSSTNKTFSISTTIPGTSSIRRKQMTSQESSKSKTSIVTKSLQTGNSGQDVKKLQDKLIAKGFLAPGKNTGYFGEITRKAVADYQKANGIYPAYGYVGAITLKSLDNESTKEQNFNRDLEVGNTGEDIKKLQVFLNNKGFVVSESGAGSPGNETVYFGEATRKALVLFQIKNGITPANGYFGPKTRNIILKSE